MFPFKSPFSLTRPDLKVLLTQWEQVDIASKEILESDYRTYYNPFMTNPFEDGFEPKTIAKPAAIKELKARFDDVYSREDFNSGKEGELKEALQNKITQLDEQIAAQTSKRMLVNTPQHLENNQYEDGFN